MSTFSNCHSIANAFQYIFIQCGEGCVQPGGLIYALAASKQDIFSQKTSDGLFLCDIVAQKLVTATSKWGGFAGDRKVALKEILIALECVKVRFFKPDEKNGGEWVRNEIPCHPQPSVGTIWHAFTGSEEDNGRKDMQSTVDWIADMFDIETVDIDVEVENILKRVAKFKSSATNIRKKARILKEASRLLEVSDQGS